MCRNEFIKSNKTSIITMAKKKISRYILKGILGVLIYILIIELVIIINVLSLSSTPALTTEQYLQIPFQILLQMNPIAWLLLTISLVAGWLLFDLDRRLNLLG